MDNKMQTIEQKMTESAGQEIFVQEWLLDSPKGVVVLVHGLGEHLGRYQHVARMMNQAGYAVVGFDLPGHGKSGGKRGHISSYQTVMDLITIMLNDAAERYPGSKLFLYGHSLGGNLVLYYGLTQKYPVTGYIATSPVLGTPDPVPAWKMAIARLLYNLVPTFTLRNGLDISGISHDPMVEKTYLADPLVHDKVSARLGLDFLNNGKWIIEHASEFPSIPLLLMQGSADRLVDPKKTDEFAQAVHGNISYKVWEGFFHELQNETGKERVIQLMIDWMDQQGN